MCSVSYEFNTTLAKGPLKNITSKPGLGLGSHDQLIIQMSKLYEERNDQHRAVGCITSINENKSAKESNAQKKWLSVLLTNP